MLFMASLGFLSSRMNVCQGPEAAMLGHWLGIIRAYYTKDTKLEEENASPEFSSCWEWGAGVAALAVAAPSAGGSHSELWPVQAQPEDF